MVNNWINIIQNYCFPPTCILCGHPGVNGLDLCSYCFERLPMHRHACVRCAEILEASAADVGLCGRCLGRTPVFDKAYAPFVYRSEISYLITTLKFSSNFAAARLLGKLLARQVRELGELPDAIVPVPLHPLRYRQRGFNQAIEIGRTVARDLHLPLETSAVIRRRDTPHQTGLAAKHRRKNMKNAFAVVKPVMAKHVAILDDVMTTGTTVEAMALQLKKAGVVRVDVWVCARA